jgi:hypothetical protein
MEKVKEKEKKKMDITFKNNKIQIWESVIIFLIRTKNNAFFYPFFQNDIDFVSFVRTGL